MALREAKAERALMRHIVIQILLAGVLILVVPLPQIQAHQPFCEFADTTAAAPWPVPDPRISYAFFGNVYPAGDIDYFSFEAEAGQLVLLSLSIPAVDQEDQDIYTPMMAALGPGLPRDLPPELPKDLLIPRGHGAQLVPLGDAPAWFYEPFGGVHFWNWDNFFFQAAQDATYTVALWHPEAEIGRYSFVIGQREEFGGDLECFMTFNIYWSPIIEGSNPYRDTPMDMLMGDSSPVINLDAASAPTINLRLFALGDGSYNLQLQTSNFTFTPQNIDKAPVLGEGHAHLYVDGVKIARLYGEWNHLPTLPPNAETLTVALYANNHQGFAVDGELIAATARLADAEDAG